MSNYIPRCGEKGCATYGRNGVGGKKNDELLRTDAPLEDGPPPENWPPAVRERGKQPERARPCGRG